MSNYCHSDLEGSIEQQNFSNTNKRGETQYFQACSDLDLSILPS